MKNQHLPKMLIIFLALAILPCQDYKAREEDKCDGIDVAKLQIDGEERVDERDKFKVNFGASYEDFVSFREDDSYGKLVKPGFVVALLFSILLLLASLAVFIILLCNLCCCKNQKNSSQKKVNIFMIINIVLFFFCFVFLICTVVYSARTESYLGEVDCASAKFASDLLEGENTDIFFIGFNPLIEILQNFSNEVSSLKETTQNFSNIKNLNLPQSAQAGIDAASNYQTKYQSVTIQSGSGTQVVPFTGQQMDQTVDAIKQEFLIYKDIGEKINLAATEGQKFSNQSEIDNIVDSINSAKKSVEEIKDAIVDFIDDFFDNLETVTDSSSKTNLGILIAVIVLAAIYIAILIILFLQINKQKCFGLNWLMKFVLIFISFIFFIITILTLSLCIVSYATDSGCNVMEEILTSNDLKKVTTELRLDIDDQFKTLMDECVTPGKEGNLSSLLPDIDFTQINVLLDGITEFSNFQKEFEANSTSKSIPVIQEQYEKIRDGLDPNTEEIVQSLATLNEGISCADQEIVLNIEQCTSGKDCKAIKDMASFTPPSCSSSSNLNTLFTNSKSYWDSNNQLMIQKLQDLAGNADTTPQTKFTQMRSNFSSAFSEFTAIKNKLTNTIAQVQEFSNGFEKITNCRIVRREFLIWEAALCFENKQTTYYTFIFLMIAGYFILLLNIFICCTMRNSKLYDNQNEDDKSPFESNNEQNQMFQQSQSQAYPVPPNEQKNFYN